MKITSGRFLAQCPYPPYEPGVHEGGTCPFVAPASGSTRAPMVGRHACTWIFVSISCVQRENIVHSHVCAITAYISKTRRLSSVRNWLEFMTCQAVGWGGGVMAVVEQV